MQITKEVECEDLKKLDFNAIVARQLKAMEKEKKEVKVTLNTSCY